LGSEADAATGASQGRHGIQTLLAPKAVAELLATYLEVDIPYARLANVSCNDDSRNQKFESNMSARSPLRGRAPRRSH
jgi:hypothetical protein